MSKRLTNKDEEGEHLRHNEQPKAPWVTFPLNVEPFLWRSVEAKATVTKLKRNTDGHQRWKAPEERLVVHASSLTSLMSAFHPFRTLAQPRNPLAM